MFTKCDYAQYMSSKFYNRLAAITETPFNWYESTRNLQTGNLREGSKHSVRHDSEVDKTRQHCSNFDRMIGRGKVKHKS